MAGEMALWKRGPEFNSQCAPGCLQPSITVVSWDQITSSGVKLDVHADRTSIYTRKADKEQRKEKAHEYHVRFH